MCAMSSSWCELSLRALGPRHVLGQQHRRAADPIRRGVHSRRRGPVIAKRDDGVAEKLAGADDAGVGGAEALAGAVEDQLLALGDGLVLRADTGHAEELPRPLTLPVAEVIVVAMLP